MHNKTVCYIHSSQEVGHTMYAGPYRKSTDPLRGGGRRRKRRQKLLLKFPPKGRGRTERTGLELTSLNYYSRLLV